MRKLLSVLALAALAAACTDQPTAVDRVATPDLRLNNLDHYTLIWELGIPRDQAWGGYYGACLNDGQGEDYVTWGGPYQYWAKVVTTPSGRQNENGYIRIVPPGGDYMEGVTTGEVWVATAYESKLGYHYFADGRWMITQPIAATYTSQRTGRQMYTRYELHWISDASGNIVGGNPRYNAISCRLLE